MSSYKFILFLLTDFSHTKVYLLALVSIFVPSINRFIQVEGAFGVIKENHNFRRFLTRGKKNVKVEFLLLVLAYNLNKLHHKIQQNRLGVSFYTKEIA